MKLLLFKTFICFIVAGGAVPVEPEAVASTTAQPAVPAPTVSPCNLEPDQGRCDALKYRFAFFTESGECREFQYGGCGGNANNFMSLADCQAACPTKTTEPKREARQEEPTAESTVQETVEAVTEQSKPAEDLKQDDNECELSKSTESCSGSVYIAQYYKEIGCNPVLSDEKPCPTAYDCSNRTTLKEDKCYHNGVEYAIGEEVPQEKSPKCLVHCVCEKSDSHQETTPVIRCISIECAELWQPPPEPGCHRLFEQDKCCSTGVYCEPKKDTATTEESATTTTTVDLPKNPARCELEGRTYVEGAKMFSDKHPCMTCICQPGFNGTLEEPFCVRAKCNVELFYSSQLRQGCVPVFYYERCCPIEWRCPNDFNATMKVSPVSPAPSEEIKEVVKPAESEASSSESLECTPEPATKCAFGGLSIEVGEKLPQDIAGNCVECTCVVPPTATCVKNMEGCIPPATTTEAPQQ